MIYFQTDAGDVAREFEQAADSVDDAAQEAAERIKGRVIQLFRLTTVTWKDKPTFEGTITVSGGFVSLEVGTDDLIYKFVDEGTKPHIIRPKEPGGRLFFQEGTPKTRAGSLGATSGSRYGPLLVAREVRHPGTRPRNFTTEIQRRVDEFGPREVEAATDRMLTRYGL